MGQWRSGGALEHFTLNSILDGESLARFGDGELKLCYHLDSLTQKFGPAIHTELMEILQDSPCMIGLPHLFGTRPWYWAGFLSVYPPQLGPRQKVASSFVSRPDESVDMPLSSIWEGRDVLLVTGGGSLSPLHMKEARSVEIVNCLPYNAYSVISALEAEILDKQDGHIVILCCGATATCLAHRLCKNGIQAVDLGYLGKFM